LISKPPIDLEVFQDAVHEWFAAATGIETIWRQQDAPQPELPFATLLIISGPLPVSPFWAESMTTDLNRPQGQEIEIDHCVPCKISVSCQVFVGMPDGRNPHYDAASYLRRAQAALEFLEVRELFSGFTISVARTGAMQNISAYLDEFLESRANMDVEFNALLSVKELIGYIKTVQVEAPLLGVDQEMGVV